jgi:hypothetical protein
MSLMTVITSDSLSLKIFPLINTKKKKTEEGTEYNKYIQKRKQMLVVTLRKRHQKREGKRGRPDSTPDSN